MLTELHIENLGVIENAVLTFGTGMIALTGETGAGKTMLVEAIDLLLGGRADSSIVRSGAIEARVDGRIVTTTSEGTKETILTRVVPIDGRSRAYVNGKPATVGHLAELTQNVIDLHGQHAHQSLLSAATQRSALDEFGNVDLEPLRSARGHLTEIEAELATLGGDERARAREVDLLRFQVAELVAAGLSEPDEDLRLSIEESTLADAVAHREAGQNALGILRDDDGASEKFRMAIHSLANRSPYRHLIDRLTGIAADLDDLGADLRDMTDGIAEDPERLTEIRNRRQLLRELQRKYGDGLSEIMAFQHEAESRLLELEEYEHRASNLDIARIAALDAERRAAADVGSARRSCAPVLAGRIESGLRVLAMPSASFAVAVGKDSSDNPGDDVRFLLSANPGSPQLPLNKVASGGELARTMLALQLVLSNAGGTSGAPTLVFDEVDAGIGGAAASSVADALASLGKHHQVLVVTHLAQVAAAADHHLFVSKAVVGDATYASVKVVTGETRVSELARMLAGTETPAALEHARDLLAARSPS